MTKEDKKNLGDPANLSAHTWANSAILSNPVIIAEMEINPAMQGMFKKDGHIDQISQQAKTAMLEWRSMGLNLEEIAVKKTEFIENLEAKEYFKPPAGTHPCVMAIFRDANSTLCNGSAQEAWASMDAVEK